MKNALTIIALLAVGGLYAAPEPVKPATLAEKTNIDKIADAHPDWDLADIAKRSPACDCEGKCKCAAPCLCNVVDEKPKPVASLPVEPQEVKFTQPQVLPVKPKAVQSCGPNGCSVQPAKAAPVVYQQQYGSCGPGGCGVRRGLFGRRR